jgi:outer membrane protein TolC
LQHLIFVLQNHYDMNTKKLIPLLLLAGAGFRSLGQTTPITLPLDSAIQMSLRQSHHLHIDKGKIDEARAKYQQARDKRLPAARISASWTRLSDNVDPFSVQLPGGGSKTLNPQIINHYTPTLSIAQTLYAGGQIRYAERSMALLEEAARLDYEHDRSDIVYNTISAYFNLFTVQQTQQLVQENIKQVSRHLTEIRNYEINGLALKNDVLKIELQLSDLEHTLIETNSSLDIANYNMNIMLGMPVSTQYFLREKDITPTPSLKSLDEYLDEAMAHRADLSSINKKMGAAILDVKSAAAGYLPTLTAGSNYYYHNPNQRVFPLEDRFKATYDMGLTLSWNIHSLYTNSHRIAESKAVLTQTLSSKQLLIDGIKMEVNAGYLTYIRQNEKTRVSIQAVEQAEENYRIVHHRFENNTVLISDLTDASTQLLQTKIHLLIDRANAGLAYYKLLNSTGSSNN